MSTEQIKPVKPAFTTSTFKVGAFVALLTPFLPILHKAAESYVGTLPQNSWLAMVMPGVLAAVYGLLRYLTVNGERQAAALVASSTALASKPAAVDTITAGGDVTVEGGHAAPDTIDDDGFHAPLVEHDILAPSDADDDVEDGEARHASE